MNKKEATLKVRSGMNAGDLTAILNDAVEQAESSAHSKLNPNLTKRQVWDIFHSALGNLRSDAIVDESIAVNILREFGENERLPKTKPSNNVEIPF